MDWKLILYFVVWFILPILYSYFRRIKLNIWELYLFCIGIIAIVYISTTLLLIIFIIIFYIKIYKKVPYICAELFCTQEKSCCTFWVFLSYDNEGGIKQFP